MQGYIVIVFGAAEPSVADAIRFILVCYWGNVGDVIEELWRCYLDCTMLRLQTGVHVVE